MKRRTIEERARIAMSIVNAAHNRRTLDTSARLNRIYNTANAHYAVLKGYGIGPGTLDPTVRLRLLQDCARRAEAVVISIREREATNE